VIDRSWPWLIARDHRGHPRRPTNVTSPCAVLYIPALPSLMLAWIETDQPADA
jgi:hypothetical protein